MLTFALLLATVSQFSVEITPQRQFTVEVVQKQPEVLQVVAVQPVKVKKVKKRYMAMFTASYCSACQVAKRTVVKKLQSKNFRVVEIDMSLAENLRKYGKKISTLPTFVAIDWQTGVWVSDPYVGILSEESAIPLLADQVFEEAIPYTDEQMRGYLGNPIPAPEPLVLSAPVRYIQWPGWGTIDLETYNRNCNCSMCKSIRQSQQDYQKQLRAYQQQIPPQSALGADQQECPMDTVEMLLDLMPLSTEDILVDLGCGDGRIVIAAARRGIHSIGVELDPVRAEVARRNVQNSGLTHLVSIETGDALEFDMKRATAATAFLYPPLLEKLSPKLRDVKIVASPFHEIPGLKMTQIGDIWIAMN
jgi:thiol-disulfide isomerase/thioredoxin